MTLQEVVAKYPVSEAELLTIAELVGKCAALGLSPRYTIDTLSEKYSDRLYHHDDAEG